MSTDAAATGSSPEKTPVERPRTIEFATAATVVRALMWVVVAFFYDPNRSELLRLAHKMADKSAKKTGKVLSESDIVSTVATTHDALKLGVPLAAVLIILAKFMRDGKSWAKWLLVITAVMTGDIFKMLSFLGDVPISIRIGYTVLGIATVASMVFMFVKPSSRYFKAVSPPLSLFRTDLPATPGALGDGPVADVGDTDVSTAIRRKPKSKSRKPATEES